jgi:hypothetical protein
MNKKMLFATLLSVATVFSASAQKLSGDISPLKTQKEVNVVLDFSETLVNGKAEDKYISDETKGKSETEKAQWLSEWNENLRSNAYAMLIKDLGDEVSEKYFSVGEYKDAEYTINIKVRDITTGFFAGIVARASAIRADVSFVKTGEAEPFASVEFKKSSNSISANVPYFITRITMSFGELGEDIGEMIYKKLKK